MVNLCPSCPLKWRSLLRTGILSSFFLSVLWGVQFLSSWNSWSTVYSFSILFTLDVVQGSEHWAPSTNPDLPSTGYMEENMNPGWGEWMRKFMWSWHEQSRHRSINVSPIRSGCRYSMSAQLSQQKPHSLLELWRRGEGGISLGVCSCSRAESNPFAPLQSQGFSSSLSWNTVWGIATPPHPPKPQRFILEPGPGCYIFGAYWHVPAVFLLIPFPCQSLCIGLSPKG